MIKNKFLKYIFIVLCMSILLNLYVYTYADSIESNQQITDELKNNYIRFEKIDSTGISDTVKNHMKTMWDAIDIYIDYIKITKTDTFENSILQIKNVITVTADSIRNATKIANKREQTYIIIVIENIKNKLTLNDLGSMRDILFNS